jgi:hypothetical protein
MPDHKILVDLKQCIRQANGAQAAMDACQATFVQSGGKVAQEGGKVFTAPDGSTTFVSKGGKVF